MIDKLKALRNMIYGEGVSTGERDNAKRLYDRLLNKYGFTDEEIVGIQAEDRNLVWFKYKGHYEKILLHQIVSKVLEDTNDSLDGYYAKRNYHGFDLTNTQERIVQTKYATLKKALKYEFKICYHAFVQVNNLGLEKGSERELTDEEKKEIERMLYYSFFMKPEDIPETNPARLIG